MWYIILKEGQKVTREQEFFAGYSPVGFKPMFAKIEEYSIKPCLYTNIDAAIQQAIDINKLSTQGRQVIVSPLAAIY